jgi:DNA protecting protein DprA
VSIVIEIKDEIKESYSMGLDAQNMVRLMQVEDLSNERKLQLADMTPSIPIDRNGLLEWVLMNREQLGVAPIAKSKLYESFQRGDDLLNKSEQLGYKTISLYDHEYPRLLRHIPNPPLILNVKGDPLHLNNLSSVAVVGTKHPSGFGELAAQSFGFRLGSEDINVVSGLSPGTSAYAHWGALAAEGTTTGILPHSLDIGFPKDTERLAKSIIEKNGFLISEYLIGEKPTAIKFAERDRIIAGMSSAVIIPQTGVKDDAMRTAGYAMEYDRKVAVYVYPKDVSAERAKGNEVLLGNEKVIGLRGRDDVGRLANDPYLGYVRRLGHKI